MGTAGTPQGSSEAGGERQGEAFLDWDIAFYEGILDRSPNHVDVLEVLGYLYTEKGEIEKGLEADLRLSILCPVDPTVRYNLACSHALMGHKDEALDALEQAVLLGFRDTERLSTDKDLESLRNERRFTSLLASLPTQPEDEPAGTEPSS